MQKVMEELGGRPRISNEKKDKIIFLSHNKKMTIREIAEEVGVSLGIAYKYADLEKRKK